MIKFENVSKRYPDSTDAVVDVSFSIPPQEFVSIVGPSGAGKTTLLKMLLLEERPSEGLIYFDSFNLNELPRGVIPEHRRRIGTIFQDFKLLPQKNAYENIAFAMEAAGRSDQEVATDVPEVLELVGLHERMWHFPHQLSGGERQRLAIARALINRPDVLIADEPTGNLDPRNAFEVIEILKKINDLDTTIILTTHNKGVIDSLKGRVITMDRGRVVRDDAEGKYEL